MRTECSITIAVVILRRTVKSNPELRVLGSDRKGWEQVVDILTVATSLQYPGILCLKTFKGCLDFTLQSYVLSPVQ